jgi:hypothetical protein
MLLSDDQLQNMAWLDALIAGGAVFAAGSLPHANCCIKQEKLIVIAARSSDFTSRILVYL